MSEHWRDPRPVLLLGATGQVGTELRRVFADRRLLALDRKAADLSQPESLRAIVREAAPSILLNAAAYTAVDRAEAEPEVADAVNHRAVNVLAEEAERAGALLVHYSTDYVFDGTKASPWVETDGPAPLNVYGASKLAGECAVLAAGKRHLILRTSWIYGPHGHNFLRTMLRLGREREVLRIVDDQRGAPTSSAALAEATRAIVDRLEREDAPTAEQWGGVYHASCGGEATWCGFAAAIFEKAARQEQRAGVWARLEPIASHEYPTPATRPRNSVLDCGKLRDRFGVQLPEWREALAEVFTAGVS